METGNYYLISHLVLFTGLTDRTIRSYLSSGILQGEKINGLWHFTPEEVEKFVCHPAVRPSILAKNNALIYDFLLDTSKKRSEICIILDLPGIDPKPAMEFFCYRITNGDFKNIRFSFDAVGKLPRIILKGGASDVMTLITEYRQRFPSEN